MNIEPLPFHSERIAARLPMAVLFVSRSEGNRGNAKREKASEREVGKWRSASSKGVEDSPVVRAYLLVAASVVLVALVRASSRPAALLRRSREDDGTGTGGGGLSCSALGGGRPHFDTSRGTRLWASDGATLQHPKPPTSSHPRPAHPSAPCRAHTQRETADSRLFISTIGLSLYKSP